MMDISKKIEHTKEKDRSRADGMIKEKKGQFLFYVKHALYNTIR